jgi:hypothetical protein
MTIHKKVKAGAVVLNDDKLVDTDDPVNLQFERYFKDRKISGRDKGRTGRPVGRPQPSRKPRSDEAPPINLTQADFLNGEAYPDRAEDLARFSKITAEHLKIIEAWEEKRLSNAQKRGDLVERSLLEGFISKLYAIDTNEFIASAGKISHTVAGLCGVNEDSKILEIENAVQAELYKTLAHIKHLMDDFLKGLKKDV